MKRISHINIALLGIALLASCQGTRQVTQEYSHRKDSVVVREVVRVDTLHIAGAETTIEVPVEVLRRDTVFVTRYRHAQARVSIQDGILTATATCDSLERLVLSYEREISRLTKQDSQSTYIEQKARAPGRLQRLLYTLGVLGLITIVIIILLKIR